MQESINQVKVIQDSLSPTGDRLVTFEIETYRYIWAEVMTHKMLSKNAQSSRAVPSRNILEVNKDFVRPIILGKNKAGMSSAEVFTDELEISRINKVWDSAANYTFAASESLSKLGLHKQWTNRITEPFSKIKAVISGTEWVNFFWLRDDPEAAQPEIVDLARKMKKAMEEYIPLQLKAGELHVPYVKRITGDSVHDEMLYCIPGGDILSEVEALRISASCCCQVSYRKLDDSFDKAMEIWDKLFDGPKPHMSPTEHQAIALPNKKAGIIQRIFPGTLPEGVSHIDRDADLWSGNFKGFIQHRKIIENKLK